MTSAEVRLLTFDQFERAATLICAISRAAVAFRAVAAIDPRSVIGIAATNSRASTPV
jgi:hypothetical protein